MPGREKQLNKEDVVTLQFILPLLESCKMHPTYLVSLLSPAERCGRKLLLLPLRFTFYSCIIQCNITLSPALRSSGEEAFYFVHRYSQP